MPKVKRSQKSTEGNTVEEINKVLRKENLFHTTSIMAFRQNRQDCRPKEFIRYNLACQCEETAGGNYMKTAHVEIARSHTDAQ